MEYDLILNSRFVDYIQIIKYTEEASVDAHRLANALKKVQDVLTATNEAVRKQENEIALMTISEQLVIPGSNVVGLTVPLPEPWFS